MGTWTLFPLGMNDAWLLPTMCLVAFALVVFIGRYLPDKGYSLTILAVGLGFVLFWYILGDLMARGPADLAVPWLDIRPFATPSLQFLGFTLYLGMTVDYLAVLMLGVVTFVALCVQVFSIGYMHGDPRTSWYFAAHSLFAAAMLGLVLASNFLVLYITWELVGLCSYLLIGFWWERRSAAEAAKKAFVTTRLGDVGFLVGVLMLWRATGSFEMSDVFAAAASGRLDPVFLTIAALLIYTGAMGKSAQFPLHVWLPDAMEGPTPVSALIHAATMVAAGVYLVARTFPLMAASPATLQVIAIIGLITTLLAGTMALVMFDIKRVLAYSTISQLGFMMVALGSGSLGYTAAMFHLMTHASFKALLFLGSGSVSHAYDSFDIRVMGGVWRKMPWTTITFVIGALAMAGLPPFAGFFSKDEILVAVREHQNIVFYGLMVVAALMSSLYMARVTFITFFGQPRDHHRYEHAHESPLVMILPLAALAIPAAISGFFAFDPVLGGVGTFLVPPGGHPHHYVAHWDVMTFSTGISLLGILVGAGFYVWKWWSADALARSLGWIYDLVFNKYYLDNIYQWCIDHIVLTLGSFIALFDRVLVNDIGVNGTGAIARFCGLVLRYHETGKLYNYAIVIVGGIVTLVVAAVALII